MRNHEFVKRVGPVRIVLAWFPYDDGQANKPHPALVLEEDEDSVHLFYGTSKRVEIAQRLDTALTLVTPQEVEQAGLLKPTAFHLNRNKWVNKSSVLQELGVLPVHKYEELLKALRASHALK